jgi:hypothetical protein
MRPPDFEDYFNIADEIDGGEPLEDLDEVCVARAKRAADHFGLSWPPYLPEAEEFWNDLRMKEYDARQRGKLLQQPTKEPE